MACFEHCWKRASAFETHATVFETATFFDTYNISRVPRFFHDENKLLLVIFHDVGGTNFGLVRVVPKLPERPALTKEIPALIQFDL